MSLTVVHIPTRDRWEDVAPADLIALLDSRPDSVWRVWPNGDYQMSAEELAEIDAVMA